MMDKFEKFVQEMQQFGFEIVDKCDISDNDFISFSNTEYLKYYPEIYLPIKNNLGNKYSQFLENLCTEVAA